MPMVLLTAASFAHAQEPQEGPLPQLNRRVKTPQEQGSTTQPVSADGSKAVEETGQDSKPSSTILDNDAVIRMTRAQVGDAILLQIIRTQPVELHTDPDDLIALKQAGVSEAVISAMLARNSGFAVHASPNPVEEAPLSPDIDDPGVYFKNAQGQWEQVSPELVKYRDGGALKSLVTNNIVKKDRNGVVSSGESSLVIERGTQMLILAPRQADPVEYLILRFREHSGRREFRVQTGNVFHSQSGTDRDQIDIPIRKISSRIFAFTIPGDLKKGEYGVLPPGSASTPGISFAGKIYTFAVRE